MLAPPVSSAAADIDAAAKTASAATVKAVRFMFPPGS
jgi:hypothetical protein